MPRGVNLATLPRASVELATFVTRERAWRSSTSRVIRLADSPVTLARLLILSSRLGASERCMIVVYSLALSPVPWIRSESRCRGRALTMRIRDRHRASSAGVSGSTLATAENILLGEALWARPALYQVFDRFEMPKSAWRRNKTTGIGDSS
jgi:hypothetical protein